MDDNWLRKQNESRLPGNSFELKQINMAMRSNCFVELT